MNRFLNGYGFAAACGLLLFIVTLIPYAVAWNAVDAEHEFSGYLHFSEDMDTYAAFVNQSEDGAWLFRNPYDTKINPDEYFNPLWLVIGKIKAVTGLHFSMLLQILRLAAALLTALGFVFLFEKLTSRKPPRIATALFLFGGGLGWALVVFVHQYLHAPDIYSELLPFFSVGFVPHAAFALALLMFSLGFFFEALKSGSIKSALISGFILLCLGFTRPYDAAIGLMLMCAVCAVEAVAGKPRVYAIKAALAPALSLPAFVYGYWLTHLSEGFSVWSLSNHYPAPALYLMLTALGIVALPAAAWLIGSLIRLPRLSQIERILLIWLVLAWFVMLSDGIFPWAFRSISSFLLPHFIAAIFTVSFLFERVRRGRKALYAAAGLCVVLMLPDAVHALRWKCQEASEQLRYYFIPPDMKEAVEWLDERYSEPQVVYTHGYYGLKVPVYSRHVSVVAHKDLVRDFVAKLNEYNRFAVSTSRRERLEILKKNNADLLLWGPFDRRLQKQSPDEIKGLSLVYENSLFKVYELNSEL